MVALGFQKQWAPMVADGTKPHTIRAPRKRNLKGCHHGEPCRVGDRLQLYSGMRTKACRKLADAICTDVTPIVIRELGGGTLTISTGAISGSIIWWEKTTLSVSEAASLARNDGFADADEMANWFDRVHGLPFKGFLVEWMLVGEV